MRDFRMLFGAVRHMARVGEDDSFKALRARNEARLAALKQSGQLYERTNVICGSKQLCDAAEYQQSLQNACNELAASRSSAIYEPGSILNAIFGSADSRSGKL